MSKNLLILFVIPLLFAACRSSKDIADEKPRKQTPEVLQSKLQAQYIDFEWFSGRAKMSYEDDEKSQSFTANIRMRRDSIVWISITSLMGVEAARVLITTDSIHILQKIGDKKYFKEPFNFIQRYVPFPFSMRVLQDVIIGNVPLEEGSKLRSKVVKTDHVLVSDRRDLESTYTLNGSDYSMTAVELIDKEEKRKAWLNFEKYETVETGVFSFKREVIFKGEQNVSAEMRFTRIKWNEPMSFPFLVSDRYEKQF